MESTPPLPGPKLGSNPVASLRIAIFCPFRSSVPMNFNGIGGGGGVENFSGSSPVNGAETHGAGLAGGEEFAVIELKGFEALAGVADGDEHLAEHALPSNLFGAGGQA